MTAGQRCSTFGLWAVLEVCHQLWQSGSSAWLHGHGWASGMAWCWSRRPRCWRSWAGGRHPAFSAAPGSAHRGPGRAARPRGRRRRRPPAWTPCFNCRMVIFGFGPGKQEDQGEVAPAVCPNCHNQVFLHHVRSKKRFSLYFVPVVPYGTDDYLVCPICSRGLQLSNTQLPYVRSMSGATASFRTGRLAEAPYVAQVERFWRQLGVNPAGQQLLTPASPGAAAPGRPVAPPGPAAAAQPAVPAQPRPAAADETSWIAHLQKLAQLHDQGVLSDTDYEAAKRARSRTEVAASPIAAAIHPRRPSGNVGAQQAVTLGSCAAGSHRILPLDGIVAIGWIKLVL